MTIYRNTLIAVLTSVSIAACGSNGPNASPTTTPPTVRTAAVNATTPEIDPGDGGNYHPNLSPSRFVKEITHRYFPMRPGSKWVYEGGGETVTVEVTRRTRNVAGITAVVVHDVASKDGAVIEDTLDYYAQDRDGNVWYLGEDTTEYENGVAVSKAGSWEHGVDGAIGGIVMPANPKVGLAYREEFLKGEAEDMGQVIARRRTTSTPLDKYQDVVVIKEWTPLEPDLVEHKYYAPGVGLVAAEKVRGATGREALVSYRAR